MTGRRRRERNGAHKPYKGTDSYEVRDWEFFFGREREANELINKILSARLTLLYAQSGAGKTSLLNAAVIPGLDRKETIPILIRFHDHPINSVKAAVLVSAIPNPAAEMIVIKRALDALQLDGDQTIEEMLVAYEKLERSDPRRRRLISPISLPSLKHTPSAASAQIVSPLGCKLLQGSILPATFARHLAPLFENCAISDPVLDGSQLNLESTIHNLLVFLSDQAATDAFFVNMTELSLPGAGLGEFMERLFEIWGCRVKNFSLVLIFDQFEELFTRFVDLGPIGDPLREREDQPDAAGRSHRPWELRWKFFDQLEQLYETQYGSPELEVAESTSRLPVRFVLSMREEYLACLDPVRLFASDLDRHSYHLGFLDILGATAAITEPAKRFGYAYDEDFLAEVLNRLTRENRYVNPAPLQIVCDRLWSEWMADHQKPESRRAGSNKIGIKQLNDIGGVEGVLNQYFLDFLSDDGKRSEIDQAEILEMLEPLITSNRTRNIVERSELVTAPFRNRQRRDRLLYEAEIAGVVRIEQKFGSSFVEIRHEFLIQPILDAISHKLTDSQSNIRYRAALRSLKAFENKSFRSDPMKVLMLDEFLALHENRERCEFPEWTRELMLRSAVVTGAQRHANDAVIVWAREVEKSPPVSPDLKWLSTRNNETLTLDELTVAERYGRDRELTTQEILPILRTYLLKSEDRIDDIKFWVRRLVENGP